jgi:hypothetical protein
MRSTPDAREVVGGFVAQAVKKTAQRRKKQNRRMMRRFRIYDT